MFDRALVPSLREALASFPVVGLVGARQVGKTTLAKSLARDWPDGAVHLDLERPSDLGKLHDPEFYLTQHQHRLVILDEVQHRPDLLPLLRALVDEDRRPGRFLLLGSASPNLARMASESLAGRIRYLELGPLHLGETGAESLMNLWLRGGFPGSFQASSDRTSLVWRDAFVRTYLERDIPALGLRLPAATLRRFWQMLAHAHGQLWNASALAASLGLSAPTVRGYLDLLEDTFLARTLQPFHANLGKRLVKSPKAYLRDTGLLHALLGISTLESLLGHPIAGPSWEGFVLEQVLAQVPETWRPTFFRTAAGAELDLVLERPGRKRLGLEIKLAAAPVPTKGFWHALRDLDAEGLVLCSAREAYALAPKVHVVPVARMAEFLQ